MTAQPAALGSATVRSHRGRPFLGLGTIIAQGIHANGSADRRP